MSKIANGWAEVLTPEYSKEYYKNLYNKVKEEYSRGVVYPPSGDIFNAFHLTDLEDVKVVILGQDPYHGDGQAHGLAFSVKPGIDAPPSLVNIYKELSNELGTYIPNNGCLNKWAGEGVLLLNTVLTVRAHCPESHSNIGWEEFTDAVIRILNEQNRPIVFMLWGSHAKAKMSMLNNPNHLVLTAPHPSPLSAYRGFFGCGHFAMANEFLEDNGLKGIDWQIENI